MVTKKTLSACPRAPQDSAPSNPLLSAPLRQALGSKGPGASPAGKAVALYTRMSQVAAAIVQVGWLWGVCLQGGTPLAV